MPREHKVYPSFRKNQLNHKYETAMNPKKCKRKMQEPIFQNKKLRD